MTNPPVANRSEQTPSTSMQDSVPGGVDQATRDRMFLRKAAAGGLAEVKLGQLAAQKGSGPDVRNFGQKMVDDHTQLNNAMAPIAQSMGVAIPTKIDSKNQAEYDKLSGLSGDDFDKEYLSYMVKDHHKDLHEFRTEAAATTDPSLKDAVTKGEKVIHEHSMMVDKLAADRGIAIPSHGPHRTDASAF